MSELLDARPPRDAGSGLRRERRTVEAARAPAGVEVGDRGREPVHVVGADDDAGARLTDERGGLAVERDGGDDRALGGEVLEDLPGEDGAAAAARVGNEKEERLRVALERERLPPRHERKKLDAVADPDPLGVLAVGGAEVADEAGDHVGRRAGERVEEWPGIATAEEAARVRDPEAVAGRVRKPGELVEVGAVLDHGETARRRERGGLPRDRPRDGDDRVRLARDESRERALTADLPAPVRERDERIAEVGDPADAGRPLRGRPDEVDGSGRRRRQDDVDAVATHEPDRGGDRRRVPEDARVRDEKRARRELHAERHAPETGAAAELLGRPARGRAEVPRAVHGRRRRELERLVRVEPLRVVGSEDVRLHAELGKVRRELERPLDARAARRREVEGDDQDLHRRPLSPTRSRADRVPHNRTVRVFALASLAAALAAAVPERGSAGALVRSFGAVADAHVSAAAPARNYGRAATLTVASSPVARAYVRFRVPDLRGVLRSAKLRLYVRTPSRAGLRARFVRNDDWGERSITYATARRAAPRPTILSGPLRGGAWATIDVTPLVRPRSFVTLALATRGAAPIGIASREAGRRGPRLVVESDPVLLAAGDIASCESGGDEATAALLARLSGTVATLGDNVYPTGTPEEFAACYAPSWGSAKARTRPAPGNHDYATAGAHGYFGYFGRVAGDAAKGYYSYDLGTWHVVVLNSNCAAVGGCEPGSPQERWLRADLASHPSRCTLAYSHHPRFSSGPHGGDSAVEPFWRALYEHRADVVLGGHDHDYERFAPQTPSGALDYDRGIRQFVVGTGGRSHYPIVAPTPNSEARNDTAFGVLRLVLGPTVYRWKFVPEAGRTFSDSGAARCR